MKREGSWSETNAKLTKPNVLDFQPVEAKDIDVYTCVARLTGSETSLTKNRSIAFDNDLNVRRLYDSEQNNNKKPEIIVIYKYGEQKFNHEYALRCISGIMI